MAVEATSHIIQTVIHSYKIILGLVVERKCFGKMRGTWSEESCVRASMYVEESCVRASMYVCLERGASMYALSEESCVRASMYVCLERGASMYVCFE